MDEGEAAVGRVWARAVPPWAGTVMTLTLYAFALNLWRESVPDGLNNDVAEEALRGIYLVQTGKFEVITAAIGNSAETLYLYLLGAVISLLGPTTLAIQVVSWSVAVACVWLGVHLMRRLDAMVPRWVTLLLFTSSVWLFHYARSGLRAISGPFFLLAFAVLLDRAERRPAQPGAAVGCGVVLALGVYAYTSCRMLPVAFAFYVAMRLVSSARRRSELLRCYGWILAAALVVSIPNLVFALQSPDEFFFRGSYVVRGGPADWARNLLWTFLLPLHYPAVYRVVVGAAHFHDGVSAGLAVAGVSPIHPIVGAAFLVGLVQAWRRRHEPATAFLLCAWITGSLVLGVAGPSLTRLLILLPVYVICAAVGAGVALRKWPQSWPMLAAVFGLVLVHHAYSYFVTFAASDDAQYTFSQVATPLGERAAELAADGRRVLCVVSKDASTVRYLTHEHPEDVRVVEFYRRPLDPKQLPLEYSSPTCCSSSALHSLSGSPPSFPRSGTWEPMRGLTRSG